MKTHYDICKQCNRFVVEVQDGLMYWYCNGCGVNDVLWHKTEETFDISLWCNYRLEHVMVKEK